MTNRIDCFLYKVRLTLNLLIKLEKVDKLLNFLIDFLLKIKFKFYYHEMIKLIVNTVLLNS
jgi:hypothetical protein